MRVHCVDCQNFDNKEETKFPFGLPSWIKEKCNAPENRIKNHKSSNARRISTPRILNRRGECLWFVPKDSMSSSSSGGEQPNPPTSSSSSS